MALSPEEIEGHRFGLSRRGYDRDEVDEFLLSVAETVRQAEAAAEAAAQAALTSTDDAPAGEDPTTHPLQARLGSGPSDTDDFGRLGAEVAAVLRTAGEGAAHRRAEAEAEATRIHDEADGYAHRLRVETEAEAVRIRADADVEARNARTALEEATEQARVIIRQADEQAEALIAEAEESAGVRRQELLAGAERQAGQAATIERDVHGRLLSARDDLDQAVARLDPEATAAAAQTAAEQASALAPADAPISDLAADDDADEGAGDLPYAAEDEPLDEPTSGPADDTIPPVPPPPPPPAGYESTDVGVAAEDLPYASDDDDEAGDGDGAEDGGEDDSVIDLRDGDLDEQDEGDEDDDGDPLAAMVRDAVGKAVQGAMRHRPGADS